ncbi:hypothetical protein N9H57_03765 [Flavobacteriaceae bacterium]|nr:hypothetical protein [Flavobacteriaceae bacterium]
MVTYSHKRYQLSQRRACKLFCISESVYRYRPKQRHDDLVREKVAELPQIHSSWGFWMMHHWLRELGFGWNYKKVYRIYTSMGLNFRRKYKRRLPSRIKEPLLQPLFPNLTWSMDFMQGSLARGYQDTQL